MSHYRLAARLPEPAASAQPVPSTVVRVGDLAVGGGTLTVIAGPCAVESRDMLLETARSVRAAGATMLRGGAFKPRTSPYAFRGLGDAALGMLAEARDETGLAVVTEVMDASQLPAVMRAADVLQIGARNMQNFTLLAAVGETGMPVVLKRGLSATIAELLMAAEYLMANGNPNVILCERGIRTFETATRNTLDVSAVPVLKRETHLPVIVDPSHAGGRADLVEPLSLASVAAGADGLLVEVHPDPAAALSDGPQSLGLDQFAALMDRLRSLAPVPAPRRRPENPARLRALRGATSVGSDDPALVVEAVAELLAELLHVNRLGTGDIVSAIFSATPDVRSLSPAAVARSLGWTDVPMLCVSEMEVDGSLPLCVRALLHVSVPGDRSLRAVYQREARALRPDLVGA